MFFYKRNLSLRLSIIVEVIELKLNEVNVILKKNPPDPPVTMEYYQIEAPHPTNTSPGRTLFRRPPELLYGGFGCEKQQDCVFF